MADLASLNLKEPDQLNWDELAGGQSKYQAPPPALDANGNRIVYQVQLPPTVGSPASIGDDGKGNLQIALGPVKVVKSGNGADGYQIRFVDASTRKWTKADGTVLEVNTLGKAIKAGGITAKPQKNAEYVAAAKQLAGKVVPVTLDWRAKHKDTGFQVRGFERFPLDPARPGQRKAILKAGDVLTDGTVVPEGVEIMFANADVKDFVTKK